MRPLVSIITPVYNSERFINATIESVINQSLKNWELIIIDDCSTDNSVDVVKKKIKEDNRIRLIQFRQNKGVVIARNKGIEEANGRFISFLDSDDLWHPNKLETQVNYMMKYGYALSYTGYGKIDEFGNNIGIVKVPKKLNYYNLLKTNYMGCLTVIYDSKLLGKKYFDEANKSEDYILWLDIIKEAKEAYGINQILAYYRVRKNSRSSNKIKAIKQQWKIYREIEEIDLFHSIYYFINYLYYGFKRYKNIN